MTRKRRHYSPEQKVALLRLHLLEKKPVSDICQEHGLSVNLFYALAEAALRERHRRLPEHRQAPQGRDRRQGPEDRCPRGQAPRQERRPRRTHGGARPAKKKTWGALKGAWVPHDTRDAIVDFVNRWSGKTGIAVATFLVWIGIATSKWHSWKGRYGKANEHNAWIPRDHWLEDTEKRAILDYHARYPLEGYRRLTFMMLDADVVACSPASVYRVLRAAGLMDRHNPKPSSKGKGFVQPLRPHEHWHVDVSYLNIAGTFYYLCSLLDGCSRSIVHWEIRETMTEVDVEQIIQRARERFPDARPRIISDNGPQFVAKDFKEFIRVCGMTHVKTSPYYPQSNGKIERFHRTIKGDCIRTETPLSLEDARRIVARYVEHYNTVRLHSAIGYVTPQARLEGKERAIFAERDRKLEAARERRKQQRQAQRQAALDGQPAVPTT